MRVGAGSDPNGDDEDNDYGCVGGGGRFGHGLYSDEDEDDYDGCGYGYDDSEDDYDLFGLSRSIFRAVERFGGRTMQSARPTPRPWPRNTAPLDVPMAVLLPGNLDVKGGASEDKTVREVRAQGLG